MAFYFDIDDYSRCEKFYRDRTPFAVTSEKEPSYIVEAVPPSVEYIHRPSWGLVDEIKIPGGWKVLSCEGGYEIFRAVRGDRYPLTIDVTAPRGKVKLVMWRPTADSARWMSASGKSFVDAAVLKNE